MDKRYEKISVKSGYESILRTLARLLDPLNYVRAMLNAITNDEFYLDDKFEEQRENLRHFFDMILPIKIEEITDNLYLRIVKTMNYLFRKPFEIEIDLDGVKRIIIKLYPNRKIIRDHRLVLDTLADL